MKVPHADVPFGAEQKNELIGTLPNAWGDSQDGARR